MIRCQFRFAPQLGEHRDHPGLHPPAHQLLGGQALAPHQVVVLRARVRGRLDDLHHPPRRDLVLAVLDVPAADQHHVVHQPLGVELGGFLTKPRSCSAWRSASGSLRTAASIGALLELDLLDVELLRHPEVEEGDAAVRHQDVVAGMRVGVEVLQVVDRAEAEAKDDLAEAAALLGVELLDLVELQCPRRTR